MVASHSSPASSPRGTRDSTGPKTPTPLMWMVRCADVVADGVHTGVVAGAQRSVVLVAVGCIGEAEREGGPR